MGSGVTLWSPAILPQSVSSYSVVLSSLVEESSSLLLPLVVYLLEMSSLLLSYSTELFFCLAP
ncbi:Hypothetical protein FKW44_019297 [Caligus rogercresseyi]|uniref:Uncharacterized protein n=1 Tax=Caligus rogercresseyi TaxID=217165 RepID=A0A7T8GVM4_CALRO|nr:Hypothetical protein FKW44_019297 [Caligus rogercresseyi]